MMLRKMWVKIKKHYYLSIGAGSFILLLLLFSPIIRSSWFYYPESLRIRIALSRLLSSFNNDNLCREDCTMARLTYEKVISQALNNNADDYLPLLEKEILNLNLSEETRAELLRLYKTNNVSASEKMKSFCLNSNNDFKIRAQLAAAWPEIKPLSLNSEVIGRYKSASKLEDKLKLLDLLKNQTDSVSLSLLWDIILDDSGKDLKQKAFFLLTNINDKKSAYHLTDLDNLRLVLKNSNYPPRSKDQAIFLLESYYDYFPEPSELLLLEVAGDKNYDVYQKTFAINILNNKKPSGLKAPELKSSDWDSYYNN